MFKSSNRLKSTANAMLFKYRKWNCPVVIYLIEESALSSNIAKNLRSVILPSPSASFKSSFSNSMFSCS